MLKFSDDRISGGEYTRKKNNCFEEKFREIDFTEKISGIHDTSLIIEAHIQGRRKKYVVYFHEKKKSKNHNKQTTFVFFFKFSLILPLLDGILSIKKKKLFCSMQLFKKPEKNTTNSAKIVIETSGLFLYCFFSSNHRPGPTLN
jgi:hypothetical protein